MTVKFKLGGTRHYEVLGENETQYLLSDIGWCEKFLMEPVFGPTMIIYEPHTKIVHSFESITIK